MDKQLAYGHPAIQQLIKCLKAAEVQGLCGIDGEIRDEGFVPQRALNDYFDQEDVLENLLRAHFPDNDPVLERIDVRQIKRSYPRIFCLLIVIGKGTFIENFMVYDISDQRLPLSKHKPVDFPADPSDSHFFETFFEHQWQFSVPKLSIMHGRRFDMSDWILPIYRVKRLGEGVSADTYQVEVHSCYDQLEAVRVLQNEIQTLVAHTGYQTQTNAARTSTPNPNQIGPTIARHYRVLNPMSLNVTATFPTQKSIGTTSGRL